MGTSNGGTSDDSNSDRLSSATPTTRPARSPLWRMVVGFVEVFVFLSISGITLSFFARWHFLADLATHFRIHYTVLLLVCGAFLSLVGSRRWGIASLMLGSILAGTLAPYFIGKSDHTTDANTMQAMSFNVLTRNSNKQAVIDYVLESDATIVVLMEVDRNWLYALVDPLSNKYPYYEAAPRGDNFGMVMFSQIPFDESSIADLGDDDLPSIDARFIGPDGKPFRVIGSHPLPPIGGFNWHSRNRQLAAVAESVARDETPTLVVGDLNCTPWSPFFADLLRIGGLRDSGKGFGIRSTWYVGGSAINSLPIDHVCVTDEIRIHSREIGPPLGSDHRAVSVEFSIDSKD